MHSFSYCLLRPVDVKGTHTHTQTLEITVFLFYSLQKSLTVDVERTSSFSESKKNLKSAETSSIDCLATLIKRDKCSKTVCMFGSEFVMIKRDFKIQQNVSRLSNSAFQFCAGVEKFLSALDGDSSTVIFWVSVSTLTCFPHTSSRATLKRFSKEMGQIFMSLSLTQMNVQRLIKP